MFRDPYETNFFKGGKLTMIKFGKSIYRALKTNGTLIMIENEQKRIYSADKISKMLQTSGFQKPEVIIESVNIPVIDDPSSITKSKTPRTKKIKKYIFICKK